MEISEVISIQVVEVISISLNWLSHHVLSVDVEVSIFDGGFQESVMVVFMFDVNFFLYQFQFISVEGTVANDISEDFDCLAYIMFEHLKLEVLVLSASVGGESCTHVFN